MTLPDRPLGDVLSLASDSVVVDPEHEYRIAGIYSFGRGLIQRPRIRGSETSYTTLTRLRAGQLAMSKLNAWEGALAVVPEEFAGAHVSPEYPIFNIDNSMAEPAYIAHLAKWPGLWERLTPRGSMVRRKRTTPATLLTAKVPLPAPPEQRRIALRLDSAFSKLRRVDELREYRDALRGSIAESAINAAVSESAIVAPIGCLVVTSRVPIEISPGEQYRALGMRSFGRGTIRYPLALGSELSKLRYYAFRAGSLVLSNIKAWEGAIGITDAEDAACVASNRFLFYSPRDDRINLSYLRHYLLSRQGLGKVAACSPGSADRNRTLSTRGFEAIEIPLPSRKVQDRVARLIDTVDASFSHSVGGGTRNAISTALLNVAFSGQL
jgi:type I restriction enzyme, S subunit